MSELLKPKNIIELKNNNVNVNVCVFVYIEGSTFVRFLFIHAVI
jgi:hypothetical protein